MRNWSVVEKVGIVCALDWLMFGMKLVTVESSSEYELNWGSHGMGDFSLVLLECGIVCGVIEKVGMFVRLDLLGVYRLFD